MSDSTNIHNPQNNSGINLPDNTPEIQSLETTSRGFNDSINFAGHTSVNQISSNVHSKALNVLLALDSRSVHPHFTVLSAMSKPQRLRFESNCINYFYEKISSNQNLKSISTLKDYSNISFNELLKLMRGLANRFNYITTNERILLDVMTDSIIHAYEVTSEVDVMNLFDTDAVTFINNCRLSVPGLNEALLNPVVKSALIDFQIKKGSLIRDSELIDLLRDFNVSSSNENPEFTSLPLLRETQTLLRNREDLDELIGGCVTPHVRSCITRLIALRERFKATSDPALQTTINNEINTIETDLTFTPHLTEAQRWYDLNASLKEQKTLDELRSKLQTDHNSVFEAVKDFDTSDQFETYINRLSQTEDSESYNFVDPLKFAAIIRSQSYIDAGIDDASARKKAALDVVSDKLHFDFASLQENEKDIDLAKNCKEIDLESLIANITIDKFAFKDDAGYQKLISLLTNRSNAKTLQTDPVKFFTQHVNSNSIDLSSIEKFVSILLPFARGIQLTNNSDELKMEKAEIKKKIAELKLDSSVNPEKKATNNAQIQSLKEEIQSLNLEISKQNSITSKSKQRFVIVKKSERYDLLRIIRAYNLLQVSESANKIASQSDVDINKLDKFVPDTVRANISEAEKLNPNRSGISRFRALAMNCFGKGYKMSDIKPHANILTKGFFGTLEGVRKLGAFAIKSPFSKLGLTAAAASFLFMPALSIPYIGATASAYVTPYLTGVLGSGMQALYGKSKNYLAPRTKASFGRFKQGRIYRSSAWATKAGVGVFNHLLNPAKYKEAIIDPFSRNFVDLFTPSKGLIGPLAGVALGTPWNVIKHAAKTLWFKK